MNANRMQLFKALCVCLFTTGTTTGFAPSHMHTSLPKQSSVGASAGFKRSGVSSLNMVTTRKSSQEQQQQKVVKFKRMSQEEESELLRQAVEFRRLNNLETELRLRSPTRDLPLLSVRAKNAGYGEEIYDYEDAMADGQTARETLVTRNMGLVHHCVNQVLSKRKNKRMNSLSYEDLVQEGAIGLARAVDRWNPDIGGRFSTYAMYWVRASVFRCIAERDDMVRVPNHVSQAIRDVNKAAALLGIDLDSQDPINGTNENWKEADAAKSLAEEAGLSDRNFAEAMKVRSRRYSGGYVAFESWMQKGNDLEMDVPMHSEDQNTAKLETEHLRVTLSKFLRPKEMEALSWRYGLVNEDNIVGEQHETGKQRANRYAAEAEEELFGANSMKQQKKMAELPAKGRWGEAMSFNEVGNKMQVSAEYGRRLCHAALAKLQQAAEEGRLEPALLF